MFYGDVSQDSNQADGNINIHNSMPGLMRRDESELELS